MDDYPKFKGCETPSSRTSWGTHKCPGFLGEGELSHKPAVTSPTDAALVTENANLKQENTLLKVKLDLLQQEKSLHVQKHAQETASWGKEHAKLLQEFDNEKQSIKAEFASLTKVIKELQGRVHKLRRGGSAKKSGNCSPRGHAKKTSQPSKTLETLLRQLSKKQLELQTRVCSLETLQDSPTRTQTYDQEAYLARYGFLI